MSKKSRTKGHDAERLYARRFREVGYLEARRQLEYHVKDCNGVDLQNTGDFAVQIKRYKNHVSLNKINEIKLENKHRVLISHADRKPPLVGMDLASAIILLENSSIVSEIEIIKFLGNKKHIALNEFYALADDFDNTIVSSNVMGNKTQFGIMSANLFFRLIKVSKE